MRSNTLYPSICLTVVAHLLVSHAELRERISSVVDTRLWTTSGGSAQVMRADAATSRFGRFSITVMLDIFVAAAY